MEIGKFYRVLFDDEHTFLLHILARVNSIQMGECFIAETSKGELMYLGGDEEHYEVTQEKFIAG